MRAGRAVAPSARAAIAAGALVLATGCAGLRAPPPPPAERPTAAVDASPEYLFLVGRQLELEGRLADAREAYARAAEKDPDAPFLQLKIAQIAARQGELSAAIEYAEAAHALDPEAVETRLLLGTLYRVRKDAAAAESVLRGEDGEPLREDAAYLLYTLYVETARYEDALETARWIVERNPGSLRGWFALAGVHERMDRPLEAERALREALDREPDNLAVYSALARTRRARGDREGEVEVYREVLERYPHHQATLRSLADALIALNRTDEAIEALEDVVKHHPEDTASSVRLALLEYDAGRFDSAAARFETALDNRPEDYEIAYLLGLVLQRMDEDDRALEAFGLVPEDHRYFVDARTQRAVIHEARREYGEALAEVERARVVQPGRTLDLYAASLRARTGDFETAVADLEGLLAESPDDDEVLYHLGVLHGEAQRYDEALRYMQSALEKNPENPAALNFVGYTWAERGENLDQAEALITRALELRPDDGYITDSLGWVYYMRARPLVESGRDAEIAEGRELLRRALRELERADELTGGDPVIAEHLGDVYLLLDDKRRAFEFYGDAIDLEPRPDEQPELQRKFERLRRELGVQ